MKTAARRPVSTVVTGSGPEQSSRHRLHARITRPDTGSTSNATSSQAANRFQPPDGRVNMIRQVPYTTIAVIDASTPIRAQVRERLVSVPSSRNPGVQPASRVSGAVATRATGTQSVSRTMVSYLSPPGQSAEFYGLYSVAGRASSGGGSVGPGRASSSAEDGWGYTNHLLGVADHGPPELRQP